MGLEISYNQCTVSKATKLLEILNPSPQLLAKERFTFQKSISNVVYDHDISSDLIVNFDLTSLSHVSPEKYTFNLRGIKNVPIKGADDKRQITITFDVSATGNFLSTQIIHIGKTERCLPNVEFSRRFYFRYTKSHWSNQLKASEQFEKIIFPYLDQIKENMA